jgi:hypothetical protein
MKTVQWPVPSTSWVTGSIADGDHSPDDRVAAPCLEFGLQLNLNQTRPGRPG